MSMMSNTVKELENEKNRYINFWEEKFKKTWIENNEFNSEIDKINKNKKYESRFGWKMMSSFLAIIILTAYFKEHLNEYISFAIIFGSALFELMFFVFMFFVPELFFYKEVNRENYKNRKRWDYLNSLDEIKEMKTFYEFLEKNINEEDFKLIDQEIKNDIKNNYFYFASKNMQIGSYFYTLELFNKLINKEKKKEKELTSYHIMKNIANQGEQ